MKIPNKLIVACLVLGFAGILETFYLTLQSFLGFELICGVVDGCSEVLTSPYASIFGIPLALFGVAYYFAVFVAGLAYLDSKKEVFRTILLGLAGIGFLISLVLLFLQVFILQAYCTYCLLSILTSTILFVVAMIIFLKRKR